MSDNTKVMYDIGRFIAEIYDQTEIQTDDVKLIKKLIQGMGVSTTTPSYLREWMNATNNRTPQLFLPLR